MDEDYAIAFWQCVVRNCNSAEVRCFCLLDVKYNALSILSPLLLRPENMCNPSVYGCVR